MTIATIEEWSLDLLDAAIDNPRQDLGDIESLAESIRQVGVMMPILATPLVGSDRLLLIAGHRRLAAAKLAGLTKIEVIVEEGTSTKDRLRKMLIENLHREDLSPLDKARGFKDLSVEGMTQTEIAKAVGISQATVSKHLSMLKLPPYAQEQITSGEITQEDAVTLAGLPPDLQEKALEGPGIAWAKRRADERVELKKEVEQLEKEGVPFVDLDTVSPYDNLGAAEGRPVRISAMWWIKIKDHIKASCRAVAMGTNGAPVEVCTEPANHPKPEPKEAPAGRARPGQPKASPEAAAKREKVAVLRAELEQGTERRRAWLLKVKPAATGMGHATLHLLLLVADFAVHTPSFMANLGIALDVPSNDVERRKAILDAVTEPTQCQRAMFVALATDIDEVAFGDLYGTEFEADEYVKLTGVEYLAAIEGLGYEPSWIECQYLGLPYEEPQVPASETPPAAERASGAEPSPAIVTVVPKGKRFVINCSAHGQVGFNTKLDMAEQRARIHEREHRTGSAA